MGMSDSPFASACADEYSFGAVLEEFEVRDALESVFYTKPEFGMTY